DLGIEREVGADALGVFTFLAEVHLVTDSAREFREYGAQPEHVRIGEEALRAPKDEVGRLDVGRDGSFDAWTQHLHHDVDAEIACAMDLAKRCGGERNAMPVGEDIGCRTPIAFENYLLYLLDRNGRNAVGQRADSAQIGLGQEIRAAGEDLADLYEAGPE